MGNVLKADLTGWADGLERRGSQGRFQVWLPGRIGSPFPKLANTWKRSFKWGNQEFGFDHAKFDMTGMYPNEIIEEMVGSLSLKFRREVELEKL